MSKWTKLLQAIRTNPRDVRLADAEKVALRLGFVGKSKASTGHKAFSRPGEQNGLNFQDRGDGKITAYQAKQLIGMMDKYEGTE